MLYDGAPMTHQLPGSIAIDGPAASGKTTVGLAIAAEFGYSFLDTGLMYRGVTLAALRAGVPADNDAVKPLLRRMRMTVRVDAAGTRVFLGGEDVTGELRRSDVEKNVSKYSALASVRASMVRRQRTIAKREATVLAGRDIGTVVLPNAPLKLYLDASEEARAKRRGTQATQDENDAKKDIASRDKVDAARAVSPMRPADDAIAVDTTNMTLEQVISFALEKVRCARN